MTHLVSDNALSLKVFEVVAQARSLALREILEELSPQGVDKAEVRAEVHQSLRRLLNEGLVARHKAPIEDFDIYHVTSEGLLAYNRLSHSGLLDEDEPLSRLID